MNESKKSPKQRILSVLSLLRSEHLVQAMIAAGLLAIVSLPFGALKVTGALATLCFIFFVAAMVLQFVEIERDLK